MRRGAISPEEQLQIVQAYMDGANRETMRARFKIGDRRLWAILEQHGVAARSSRKYPFQYDFFAHDTVEAAYWAGFIMADGSISEKRDALSITLSAKDTPHLERLCDDIGMKRSAIQAKTAFTLGSFLMCGLTLRHPRLRPDLVRWGVIPRKTYNYQAPSFPPGLLSHYLRGWFDGDGSMKWGSGDHSVAFSVTGNQEALGFYQWGLRELGYTGNVPIYKRFGRSYGDLQIGGNVQVQNVLAVLDPYHPLSLARKWEPIREWLATRRDAGVCIFCGIGLKSTNRSGYCAKHHQIPHRKNPRPDGYQAGVCALCGVALGNNNNSGYCWRCYDEYRKRNNLGHGKRDRPD